MEEISSALNSLVSPLYESTIMGTSMTILQSVSILMVEDVD
jgi:hypothetical protein